MPNAAQRGAAKGTQDEAHKSNNNNNKNNNSPVKAAKGSAVTPAIQVTRNLNWMFSVNQTPTTTINEQIVQRSL